MRFKYYLRGAGIGVIVATLILSVAFLFHDNISDEEVIRRAMKLGMIMQENTSGTLADPPQSGASSVDLETGTDPDPLTDPNAAANPNEPSDPNAAANPDEPSDPNAAANPDQPSELDAGADTGQSSDSPEGGNPDDASDGNAGGNTSQPSDGDANGDAGKPSKPKADEKTDPPADSKAKDSSKDKSPDTKTEDNKPENSDEVEIVIASGDVSRMVSAKVFEAGLVDDADEFNSYLGSHDYDNMLQPGTYKIKKGSSFQQIAKILTRQ